MHTLPSCTHEQVHLIDALPYVQRGSFKIYESDQAANLNKVEATTWCCWSSGRLKRVKVACDKSGEKPTELTLRPPRHCASSSSLSMGRRAILYI